jgi:hypothetical protein
LGNILQKTKAKRKKETMNEGGTLGGQRDIWEASG